MEMTRFRIASTLFFSTAALSVTACDRPASIDAKNGGSGRVDESVVSPAPSRGPADVARRLNTLHITRDYVAIASHIVADRRDSVVEILRALDAVLEADARLRDAATKRFGGPEYVAWNLSVLQNNLGVFSKETNILNQSFQGDFATVTLQEGDHLPLVRAPFKQVQGHWYYAPDMPPAAMTGELRRLAMEIDNIRQGVESGFDYAEYLESFPRRVVPAIRRITLAKDEPAPRVTAANSNED
ncbi:MAG: hypothetical protein KF841_16750 [Phycisphaerae bacterium]|nr:hypothetical protein [Phycisphaerae bacterium]